MANKIKNLHDLGTDLLNVYTELRNGQIETSTARSLAGVAGKVIDSLKVQIDYNSKKANINKIQLMERGQNGNKLLTNKN